MGPQTFMIYGLQILMGLQTYELRAPNVNGPQTFMTYGLQTFLGYGLKILMGLQAFMNHGLQILMGPHFYEL